MSGITNSSPRILKSTKPPSDLGCTCMHASDRPNPDYTYLRMCDELTGIEDAQAGDTEVLTTGGTKVVVGCEGRRG